MHTPPHKLLDYRGAVALVIANTIGTGVFTTSGFALADLGSPIWVLLAWLVGGIYALCGVVIYSDLAQHYPHSGGEYAFLRYTLHPALGTVAGWISLVAGFTSPIAAAALGAQLYFVRVMPLDTEQPWIASIVIVLLGVLHGFFPREGVRLQNQAVLLKVVVILLFIVFGLIYLPEGYPINAISNMVTEPFSVLNFAGSLVWISFAYSGWNAAVYVTGEIEGGGKTVSRALFSGTMLVICLYLGVSTVILLSAPVSELSGVAESGATAARALAGEFAEKALSALIALALMTSVSSMLITGPRVYAQMAKDGVLPKALGCYANGHPRLAIILQSLICLVLVWLSSIRELLEFAGICLSVSAGMVVLGWLRLIISRSIQLTLLKLLASMLFLLATMGIFVASLQMRKESLFALFILMSWGVLAHFIIRSKNQISNKSGGNRTL